MHFCASIEEQAFAGQRPDAAAATTLAEEIASLLTKLFEHYPINPAISIVHPHISTYHQLNEFDDWKQNQTVRDFFFCY